MVHLRILRALVLIGALTGCNRIRPQPLAVDRTSVAAYSSTFLTREGEDSIGTMTLALLLSPDSVVSVITGFYHDTLSQLVTSVFERGSLRLVRVRDSMSSGWDELTYDRGELRGWTLIQNPRGALDTVRLKRPIDSLTIDRRSLLAMVPWLPLTSGRVFRVRIYDPSYHTIYPVLVAVGERAPIAVTTGRFEAYRVNITTLAPKWVGSCGGIFPTILWIRADGSRQIVRIERPEQRVVHSLLTTQVNNP
jgi:hypothetical protein